MKRINYLASMICIGMLLFASCSKDDPAVPFEEDNKAKVSFGAVLNDLTNDKSGKKQDLDDFPACTDAAPSYVAVVLSGTSAVGSMEEPLVIPLSSTPDDIDNDGDDEYFTRDSPALELKPGLYSLDFFAVYDSEDNLIWLAPTNDGDLAGYVNALPMDFKLAAGLKKYLDVDVLCFDNRLVNL